ncbi:MAG: hypothetical protein H0Z35_02430 [Thermoanaerobacteraceae bacterium]|nr:hypothetical protein [Thermoanaerobacteraceae bacterium]
MSKLLDYVMDALDVETFLICDTEEEGRTLVLELMKEMGFSDIDVINLDFQGVGARVRVRAYIHRSGDEYGWLQLDGEANANG